MERFRFVVAKILRKTRGGWSKELIAFRKDAFKEYLILGIHPKELDIKDRYPTKKNRGVCESRRRLRKLRQEVEGL